MKHLVIAALAAMYLVGCTLVTGPQGPPGNANVHTVTLAFAPESAAFNGSVASRGYTVSGITPSVVDRGAVLAYFRDQGTWTALPFTIGVEDTVDANVDYTFTMGYAYDDEFLEVFIEASTADVLVWDDIVSLLQEEYIIKVVVIDGFAAARRAGLDVSDYDAVRAFYALEDL